MIGQLSLDADGGAELLLAPPGDVEAPPVPFRGTAIEVGWRRGRIAQRLYLQDAAGRRVSLLLGFPPDDLAAYAAAWLAFPPDLPALIADRGARASGG